MIYRIIVTQEPAGHWSACFDDQPTVSFGGDWPTIAVERLLEASPERGAIPDTIATVDSETNLERMVFTIEADSEIRDRARLRHVFAAYGDTR